MIKKWALKLPDGEIPAANIYPTRELAIAAAGPWLDAYDLAEIDFNDDPITSVGKVCREALVELHAEMNIKHLHFDFSRRLLENACR